MAEVESIGNLLAARTLLKTSLEKSRALASALEKTGPRLEEISQKLPSLETAFRPTYARKCTIVAVGYHIDRAVGPAAAVLKVLDAVHGLEKSLLSEPCSNLYGYLPIVKRLEEALKFLADNCGLAIQWLEDIVEYLEENAVADDRYLSNLKKSLEILMELQATEERARLDGGLLSAALDKLEVEFRRLLTENSLPLPMASLPFMEEQATIAPSPLPVSIIQNLQAIIERLNANNRLEKCKSIYVEVRSWNARASLRVLDLDYLEITISESESVQGMDDYIYQWGKHLEFAVKHLFDLEYKLCNEVFDKIELDVSMCCFAKIAAQSGILAFLQFGNNVTKSKKDPIKLLRLLDIFIALNKLRQDFNRLFSTKACIEIQTLTRDLIKRIVDGACEIFLELVVQVELQRQTSPPLDGNIPRVVSFVTDYCNQLLGDSYRPILTQVLIIHRSWKHEKYEGGLLENEIRDIINTIRLNLETWSNAYENTTLSYIFLINNHWHLYTNSKGTKLGELMGNSWLKGHEQYLAYYTAVYLRESWGKLPALLSQEDLIFFAGGRATGRNLVKKRLKAFNEAFDVMYKKQSNWVMFDKNLREKTCQLVVQTIVPAYRSYMQNYGPFVEHDASACKYVKYTAQSLENTLSSLFQPKIGKYGSTRNTHLLGKLKNVVANQFRSTLTAA